jgi:periplasmic protein TonB
MGVEGKVFVEFIVNKDGSISDVTVKKGIGAGCDKAAIEAVSASPKWKPGKQAGLIVRQKFTVPIQFKLG